MEERKSSLPPNSAASIMRADLRESALYKEAEVLYRSFRRPGAGEISDAADLSASPDNLSVVFTGTVMEESDSIPRTRICLTDIASGRTKVLTSGRNSDRSPKYSPDGRRVAFLSDRQADTGDFQLYLLDPATGATEAAGRVEGWVEYIHWSPDGSRILLGASGHGADVAGGYGAVQSKLIADEVLAWMPMIASDGKESYRWRSIWIFELFDGRMSRLTKVGTNVWESSWCGDRAIVAVVSDAPGEGFWYSARLQLIDVESAKGEEIYRPRDQLGCSVASVSGEQIAIIEAVCSDRGYVCGRLLLVKTASNAVESIDTQHIDISCIEWRSERHLLLAGHRGFETVVAIYDTQSRAFTEVWCSRSTSTGGFYARVVGFKEIGDCLLVSESFTQAPELAAIERGKYRPLRSFDLGYSDKAAVIARVECVTWRGAGDLAIQGWLLLPRGEAPHPLVLSLHGGPIWHWRPTWLGRRAAAVLMLLSRGCAILFPNPRGSSGRGMEFARHVRGEIGGDDGKDCLCGIDHLVRRGLVDPKRLGVTGVSYGGFMTAWLITQDRRFSAACMVAPVTNHVTEHLLSSIPHFVRLFLSDEYTNLGGKYFTRSPVMYARAVKTPTLIVCGALDRCTPPQEGEQFHKALMESNIRSALLTYPEEGHGIRKFPAVIDFAARVTAWFQEHLELQGEA